MIVGLTAIEKQFGAVRALDGVDLRIGRGEVGRAGRP